MEVVLLIAAIELTIVGLILFNLPGYILTYATSLNYDLLIKRLYVGFCFSIAMWIPVGIVLSYFSLLNFVFTMISLVVLSFLSLVICKIVERSRRNIVSASESKINDNRRAIKTFLLAMFALTFCLTFVYLLHGSGPLGWDRGKHFGYMIYITEKGHLPKNYLGTPYNQFYFLGFHIVSSIFLIPQSLIIELFPKTLLSFDALLMLSISFKFFIAILVGLCILAVYFVSKTLFNNSHKIGLISSILFIFFLGGFSTIESIGMLLGFVVLGTLILLTSKFFGSYSKPKAAYIDYSIFSLLLVAVILSHLFTAIFAFGTIVLATVIGLLQKEQRKRYKHYMRVLGISLLTLILLVVFLFAFYREFLFGILEELIRAQAAFYDISFIPSVNPLIQYITNSLFIILDFVVLLPFFFLGLIYTTKYCRSYGIVFALLICSLFLSFYPLTPVGGRAIFYLMYPVTLLSGLGVYHLIMTVPLSFQVSGISKKDPFMKYLSLILLPLIVVGVLSGVNKTIVNPPHNFTSLGPSEIGLANWIKTNADPSDTIVFPTSGPRGYLLIALTDYEILLADPRFPDIPSMHNLSRLYLRYPTAGGLLDFVNISLAERLDLIQEYGVDIIIAEPIRPVDLVQLEGHYPYLETFRVSYYTIIVINDQSS